MKPDSDLEKFKAILDNQQERGIESGDVLFTLLALSPHGLPEIIEALENKCQRLLLLPPYEGEARVDG